MSTPPSEHSGLEHELAGLLVALGNHRVQLEESPAGLLGAQELAGLEGRMEELRAHWAALPDGD